MTHVTCRLTAKDRDPLRNPTLGNRVWASLTFLNVSSGVETQSGPQFGEHDSRGMQHAQSWLVSFAVLTGTNAVSPNHLPVTAASDRP